MAHELPIRVYYEDTDAGGIVFYANYLKFAERGRTEYLRTIGHENSAIKEQKGVLIVVRRLEADYHNAALLDDLLSVRTAVDELKNSSFTMTQEIYRDGDLLFSMKVLLVCVNADKRPVRIPDDLKAAMAAPGT